MELNNAADQGVEFTTNEIERRRDLLPWWIKTFTWIFLVLQAISIIYIIGFLIAYFFFGLQWLNFKSSLYGLNTNDPGSLTGIIIFLLFQLKGITAYSLWKEKDWAINLGLADAVLGIAVCLFMMLVFPLLNEQEGFKFDFRLEILLLIPYFIRLSKIKPIWYTLKK